MKRKRKKTTKQRDWKKNNLWICDVDNIAPTIFQMKLKLKLKMDRSVDKGDKSFNKINECVKKLAQTIKTKKIFNRPWTFRKKFIKISFYCRCA